MRLRRLFGCPAGFCFAGYRQTAVVCSAVTYVIVISQLCKNRSLARGCLGIALQMQGNTSRDSGRLNCYRYFTLEKIELDKPN
ncbi:hypothetical protein E5259_05035 [Blautia producta]|uniref:Uncharacterized protein n=1 Tax=Blautia producta TaxID=33035 RepID=A0A7G5MQX2_9FIRM|nr:hypothetical protein E5259_05035 [Blautia producta]